MISSRSSLARYAVGTWMGLALGVDGCDEAVAFPFEVEAVAGVGGHAREEVEVHRSYGACYFVMERGFLARLKCDRNQTS